MQAHTTDESPLTLAEYREFHDRVCGGQFSIASYMSGPNGTKLLYRCPKCRISIDVRLHGIGDEPSWEVREHA